MIKSMTAYASSERSGGDFSVEIEVRSYNHRFLDMSIRVPKGYSAFEEKLKSVVTGKVARGRVEIKLSIRDESKDSTTFEIDTARASAYSDCLVNLKNMYDLEGSVTIDLLSSVGGIINMVEPVQDLDKIWPVVEKTALDALDKLDEMRMAEGEFLGSDFHERLQFIEDSVEKIEIASADLPEQYRQRLVDRITALTKGVVELDEARIAQEAAFLADKSDICEETVRARSHIKQFRDIMKLESSGGRKLNFLLQEFNREFNTIGSKTGSTDISHTVVAVKSELEKLREQVQNVE